MSDLLPGCVNVAQKRHKGFLLSIASFPRAVSLKLTYSSFLERVCQPLRSWVAKVRNLHRPYGAYAFVCTKQ
eukprot:2930822-Heterocapsa_arctica.AAC.1